MKIGIYQIRNIINNKVYIGSSIHIIKRFREHKNLLKRERHHSLHLQNAWNEYGEQNFIFEILEEVGEENLLFEREQYWMDKNMSYKQENGYNINQYAESCYVRGENHPFYGVKREDHSERMMGKNNPMYGVSPWNKGKKIPEHSKRMKELQLSKRPDIRKKLSETSSGERNAMSKLTWEKVEEIRSKYIKNEYGYKRLAKEYNVTPEAIKHIVIYKSWRNKNNV